MSLFSSELNDTVVEAQLRTRQVPPSLPNKDAIQSYLRANNRLIILVSFWNVPFKKWCSCTSIRFFIKYNISAWYSFFNISACYSLSIIGSLMHITVSSPRNVLWSSDLFVLYIPDLTLQRKGFYMPSLTSKLEVYRSCFHTK